MEKCVFLVWFEFKAYEHEGRPKITQHELTRISYPACHSCAYHRSSGNFARRLISHCWVRAPAPISWTNIFHHFGSHNRQPSETTWRVNHSYRPINYKKKLAAGQQHLQLETVVHETQSLPRKLMCFTCLGSVRRGQVDRLFSVSPLLTLLPLPPMNFSPKLFDMYPPPMGTWLMQTVSMRRNYFSKPHFYPN